MMSQLQHGLTRTEYLRIRAPYLPEHRKIVFVLESPPNFGLYFYNPEGWGRRGCHWDEIGSYDSDEIKWVQSLESAVSSKRRDQVVKYHSFVRSPL